MATGRIGGGKMSDRTKRIFWLIVRITLGAILIGSSLYKIQSPASFAQSIYNYKLLPVWLINPVAIVLPWFQVFCGLGLILNIWIKGASLFALLMMLTFQAALTSALLRDLNVSCGCFKSGGDAATWTTVMRDFLITMLALAQFAKTFKPKPRNP